MSFLVKWLENMHFDLNITNKCSRKRTVYSTCSVCMEACSLEALSINQQTIEINREKCSSCGDCVISCPVSAIEGIAFTREFENQSLIYNEFYIPSVKEMLIYKCRGLASVKMDCNRMNQQWETVMKQTNKILIELGQRPIELVQKNTKEKYSRRAFFTSMQTEGKKLAKSLAPASWRMLANEWNLANYFPEYQFYTVELDHNKCILCRACFSFCPQEVFHIRDSVLHIESNKCVKCCDCTDICLENAIQIRPEIKIKSESPHPFHIKECGDCGQSYYSFQSEAEKCPICVNRNPEWLSPYQ
ncbi:DUF362 domain-containing protein [Bacillus sp. UNC41MFS5]|uniref:DUF362 domain-containing protein n=1 Tax=Bacillus sp. UNC41MFS5 TaxID=1449046 RepID=UPI00047B377C|nr:4Fe-4S binding protein [Bacillus sp. UNC41MFS5]